MNKLSDRIDFMDKILDLRNYYIDYQRQRVVNEIKWLEANNNNIDSLRSYFMNVLNMRQVKQFSDDDIQQLAEIRGNNLYSDLRGMSQQKIETKPLKILVQELKYFGQ